MNDKMEQEPPLEPARGNLYRKHYIGIKAIKFDDIKCIISMDLPGRFPKRLTRRNAYAFLMYDFDSNCIISVPNKNRIK